MTDFDRRSANCWHGKPLYECDDPEHATKRARVGRVDYAPEVVTYYRGTAEIYTNITDKSSDMYGGSGVEYLSCPHRHKDAGAATRCGQRLAQRAARERNRQFEAEREAAR